MIERKDAIWKVVASYLATALFAGLTAFSGAWMTFPPALTKEDVKDAVEDTFTGISNERGMYAIEGRPRLESLERTVRLLESQQAQILNGNARIEAKLDLMKDN